MREKQNNNNFSFMKLLASIIIVIFHTGHSTVFYKKISPIFLNGNMWVNFFLLTSGFLMAKNYYHKNFETKTFIKNFLIKFI